MASQCAVDPPPFDGLPKTEIQTFPREAVEGQAQVGSDLPQGVPNVSLPVPPATEVGQDFAVSNASLVGHQSPVYISQLAHSLYDGLSVAMLLSLKAWR